MKILPSSGTEPGREGQAPDPSAAPRGRVGRRFRRAFPKERETPLGQRLQMGINAFRAQWRRSAEFWPHAVFSSVEIQCTKGTDIGQAICHSTPQPSEQMAWPPSPRDGEQWDRSPIPRHTGIPDLSPSLWLPWRAVCPLQPSPLRGLHPLGVTQTSPLPSQGYPSYD